MKKYKLFAVFLFLAVIVLSGCKNNNTNGQVSGVSDKNTNTSAVEQIWPEYTGEKGQTVEFADTRAFFDKKSFDDGKAQFINAEAGGKTVYFFIVKDKNGVYRAAANACQVCADAKMGFRQEGNFMVCNTCGNRYPMEKIATEKGGCNPVPISPNLQVEDGNIIVQELDLKQIINFF